MIEDKGVRSQEDLSIISSHISKQLKKNFGKGPEACYCIINNDWKILLVQIRNFMTPSEEVLVGKNKLNLAFSYRAEILKSIFEDTAEELSELAGFEIETFLYDWNYLNNTGTIFMAGETEAKLQHWKGHTTTDYPFLKLEEKVEQVFSSYHKKPSNIETRQIQPNVLIVQCNDVSLSLENVLLEKGHEDLLVENCIKMRLNIYQHKSSFEQVLQQNIQELYFLRNAFEDKSYIVFYLE